MKFPVWEENIDIRKTEYYTAKLDEVDLLFLSLKEPLRTKKHNVVLDFIDWVLKDSRLTHKLYRDQEIINYPVFTSLEFALMMPLGTGQNIDLIIQRLKRTY